MKQQEYLILQIGNIVPPIKAKRATLKDKLFRGNQNKRKYTCRSFLKHPTELTFSFTYHAIQGTTTNSLILSLNACSETCLKINGLTLKSLYVGLSRVHERKEYRVLPLNEKDKAALKRLRHDPYLKLFFKNYDENGGFKMNGLKRWRDEQLRLLKIQLGMIELDAINCDEARKFVRNLDLIIPCNKPSIHEYINILIPTHTEGRLLLLANNEKLLLEEREKLLSQVQQKNIQGLGLKQLRYYAKRLGIKNSKRKNKAALRCGLESVKVDIITKQKQLSKTKTRGKKRKLQYIKVSVAKKRKLNES